MHKPVEYRKIYLIIAPIVELGRESLKISLNLQALSEKKKESLITAIYIGVVFILLAIVYYANLPNSLWNNIVNFFGSFTLAEIPGAGVSLPAPVDPHAFVSLYSAVFEFLLGVGILEIGILALRIYLQSPVARKAETVANIVFWLGASFLAIAYLVKMTIMTEWFMFWAAIILLGGVSLLVRASVILAKRYS
jgi:hypothetical protein